MKRLVLIALLWFYAGWYGGALLAEFTGLSPFLGPMVGVAAAILIVAGPRRIRVTKRESARDSVAMGPEAG